MKPPTQSDVARLAGVSRATVSYVLNGQANGRVPISEETQQRVRNAAIELHYEPDLRAQSLRSGSTKIIGLLIPDLNNPHFWQIIDGATQEARQAGYDVLLASSNLDPMQEEACLKALSRRRVDGLILLTAFTTPEQSQLDKMAARKLPITMIGFKEGFDSIGAEYGLGAKLPMQHLLDLGHRRIGFIHGVAKPTMGKGRLQSYRDELEAAGIAYDDSLVIHCGPSVENGQHAAHQLLSQTPRPTAIVAINDLLALGAIRAAADLNLRVPQDVSLVGFDDIPMASYATPRLTTVQTQADKIGRGAVKMLLKRLKNKSLSPQTVHLSATLVIRESTAIVPDSAEINPENTRNL